MTTTPIDETWAPVPSPSPMNCESGAGSVPAASDDFEVRFCGVLVALIFAVAVVVSVGARLATL